MHNLTFYGELSRLRIVPPCREGTKLRFFEGLLSSRSVRQISKASRCFGDFSAGCRFPQYFRNFLDSARSVTITSLKFSGLDLEFFVDVAAASA